jgi:hypothetical protein
MIIDRNTVEYRASRIKMYAYGFGTHKEQRSVIDAGSIEDIEKALEFINNDMSSWNADKRPYAISRLTNRLNYLKSLTPKN